MFFVNWEFRPALLSDDRLSAVAVLEEGGAWETVDAAEVVDSGRVVAPDVFRRTFGELPDVPASITGAQSGPSASAAAE